MTVPGRLLSGVCLTATLQPMPESNCPRPAVLAFLLLIFFSVWFGVIEYRKLVKPDEGRYAEVPREMVATGDWLTPRLNGIKYFEKPPMQYWATATAYFAFGQHHWTARLWSALTGLLGLFVIWFTGRQLFGEPAGTLAALATMFGNTGAPVCVGLTEMLVWYRPLPRNSVSVPFPV